MDHTAAAHFVVGSSSSGMETSSVQPVLPRLSPFPVPVHFVFQGRKAAWLDLFDGSAPPDPDAISYRIVEVEECWIVQTYLRLWHARLNVTLSDAFDMDAINVVSYHDLAIRTRPIHCYVVATQHDAARPEICDWRVVQNELNVLTPRDHFIPHWPQPGLISRDSSRGSRIQTLCFKGSECNLYHEFRSPRFIADLAELGIHLQFDVKERVEGTVLAWNDYRDCDLVLAVRDATKEDLCLKPASKLVNAWLAGAPALLGPEPAFASLRRNLLDYFEVRTPQDALQAVRRLLEEPGLYQAMVHHGQQRGEQFTHPRITARWHGFLAGPVAEDFCRWQSRSAPLRAIVDPLIFALRAVRHKRYLRKYLRQREHGFRPISNRYT